MHVKGHDPQFLGLYLQHCLLCSNFESRGHSSTALADAIIVGWSKLIAHGECKKVLLSVLFPKHYTVCRFKLCPVLHYLC